VCRQSSFPLWPTRSGTTMGRLTPFLAEALAPVREALSGAQQQRPRAGAAEGPLPAASMSAPTVLAEVDPPPGGWIARAHHVRPPPPEPGPSPSRRRDAGHRPQRGRVTRGRGRAGARLGVRSHHRGRPSIAPRGFSGSKRESTPGFRWSDRVCSCRTHSLVSRRPSGGSSSLWLVGFLARLAPFRDEVSAGGHRDAAQRMSATTYEREAPGARVVHLRGGGGTFLRVGGGGAACG
jgi:hypothetical protein